MSALGSVVKNLRKGSAFSEELVAQKRKGLNPTIAQISKSYVAL